MQDNILRPAKLGRSALRPTVRGLGFTPRLCGGEELYFDQLVCDGRRVLGYNDACAFMTEDSAFLHNQ